MLEATPALYFLVKLILAWKRRIYQWILFLSKSPKTGVATATRPQDYGTMKTFFRYGGTGLRSQGLGGSGWMIRSSRQPSLHRESEASLDNMKPGLKVFIGEHKKFASCCNTNLLGKLYPLTQRRHDLYGGTNYFLTWGLLHRGDFMSGTVNLVKSLWLGRP